MNKKMIALVLMLPLILTNLVPVFASADDINYEKFVGFKYDISGSSEIVKQNYTLFADYSIDSSEDINLYLKTNVNEIKDINYIKLKKVSDGIYTSSNESEYKFLLDLTSDKFILNILIDNENYVFSKTSRCDIVKAYIDENINNVTAEILPRYAVKSSDSNVIAEDSTSRIFFQSVYEPGEDYLSIRVNTKQTEPLSAYVTKFEMTNGKILGNNIHLVSVTPTANANNSEFVTFVYFLLGFVNVNVPSFSDNASITVGTDTFKYIATGLWEDYNSLNYTSNGATNGIPVYVNMSGTSIPTSVNADVKITYYASLVGYLSTSGSF
jgi:hypothetical protein